MPFGIESRIWRNLCFLWLFSWECGYFRSIWGSIWPCHRVRHCFGLDSVVPLFGLGLDLPPSIKVSFFLNTICCWMDRALFIFKVIFQTKVSNSCGFQLLKYQVLYASLGFELMVGQKELLENVKGSLRLLNWPINRESWQELLVAVLQTRSSLEQGSGSEFSLKIKLLRSSEWYKCYSVSRSGTRLSFSLVLLPCPAQIYYETASGWSVCQRMPTAHTRGLTLLPGTHSLTNWQWDCPLQRQDVWDELTPSSSANGPHSGLKSLQHTRCTCNANTSTSMKDYPLEKRSILWQKVGEVNRVKRRVKPSVEKQINWMQLKFPIMLLLRGLRRSYIRGRAVPERGRSSVKKGICHSSS